MNALLFIGGSFFFLVNFLAFFLISLDKRRSMQNGGAERIPEGLLFFLATVFGSIGVYVGMFVFRHKTRVWYFLVGIPLLMCQNIAFLYEIYDVAQMLFLE